MAKNVLSPWKPARGEWNRAAATHLFRRGGFGANTERIDRALKEGVDASVTALLEKDAHDERMVQGVERLLPAGDVELLQAWWMSLVLGDGAPLRERVTLMWHDHFATSNDKVDDVRLMHRQNVTLREMALGDFRVLLHAMAKDPAMLVWLDGNANKRGQANENFAREVMELFGLGIGNYTEDDVLEAARAFTGWGTKGRSFVVREHEHDPGEKKIFGKRGAWRGEDAIDLILAHPACPRFVAARLLSEFVSATPKEAWVTATADALVAADWNVGRTIEQILRSELFFSPSARRSRISAPVELVASTLRALDAHVAPKEAVLAAAEMGQALFRPPSVKGWDGMRTWINAGTWVSRHNSLFRVAAAHPDGDGSLRVDLKRAFGSPASKGRVASAVQALLVPGLDAPDYSASLERAAESASDVDEALRIVTALVFTSPEYHLT